MKNEASEVSLVFCGIRVRRLSRDVPAGQSASPKARLPIRQMVKHAPEAAEKNNEEKGRKCGPRGIKPDGQNQRAKCHHIISTGSTHKAPDLQIRKAVPVFTSPILSTSLS